jgi:hypothetical protein
MRYVSVRHDGTDFGDLSVRPRKKKELAILVYASFMEAETSNRGKKSASLQFTDKRMRKVEMYYFALSYKFISV